MLLHFLCEELRHLWGLYLAALDVKKKHDTFIFFVAGPNVKETTMALRFVCCCTECKKSHDTFRVYMLLP